MKRLLTGFVLLTTLLAPGVVSAQDALMPGAHASAQCKLFSANQKGCVPAGGFVPAGVARMWPQQNQSWTPTVPWNVMDPWGNNLAAICSGTTSMCLQEFINYTSAAGWAAEVDGNDGIVTVAKLAGTVTNGSKVVTGLSSTAKLSVGDIVVGNGTNASFIGSGVTIASVNSATQVTLSANASGSGTVTLWFSDPTKEHLLIANSTIQIPSVQDWWFFCKSCFLGANHSDITLQFDSFENMTFRFDGLVVPNGTTSNPTVAFAPTNGTPNDNIVGDIVSNVEFQSIIGATGQPNMDISYVLTNGPITGNTFMFSEVGGGNYGIAVSSPSASPDSFSTNIIIASGIHTVSLYGVVVGTGGTTLQTILRNNQWNVTVSAAGSGCMNTNAVHDSIRLSCDASTGTALVVGGGSSAINGVITLNGSITPVSGNFSGLINNNYYLNGVLTNP